MSQTIQEAAKELENSIEVLKQDVFKSYPFINKLPYIRDKEGKLRFFVLLLYGLIFHMVIDVTAFVLDILFKHLK
jgi:tetrahydromethanopterin S-methyltransferase subunit B